MTHSVSRGYALYIHLPHLENDSLCRVEGIAVYCGPESKELILGEAILVNDLHLFDYCRLSRFA